MRWVRRLRERRGANRDLSILWGQVHDLADYLNAVKRELEEVKAERDAWQRMALDAVRDREMT
jgi:hypothetical protein